MMAADKNEHVSHTLGRTFFKVFLLFLKALKVENDIMIILGAMPRRIVSSNEHVPSRINIFALAA